MKKLIIAAFASAMAAGVHAATTAPSRGLVITVR